MLDKLSKDTFSTSDTALAAWLVSQGFELLDLDFSRSSSVAFLFSNDTEVLSQAVKTFQLGEAEGNVLAFFRAYKRMLLKIREGKI